MTFEPLTEYEKVTPLNIGIHFEDLHVPVNGSEQIHAWWIPSSSNEALLFFRRSGTVIEDNIDVARPSNDRRGSWKTWNPSSRQPD